MLALPTSRWPINVEDYSDVIGIGAGKSRHAPLTHPRPSHPNVAQCLWSKPKVEGPVFAGAGR